MTFNRDKLDELLGKRKAPATRVSELAQEPEPVRTFRPIRMETIAIKYPDGTVRMERHPVNVE